MKKYTVAALLSILAAACAAPSASNEATPHRERAEKTTGSNIPRRNDGSVTTMDREGVERAQAGSYGTGMGGPAK